MVLGESRRGGDGGSLVEQVWTADDGRVRLRAVIEPERSKP